MRRRLSTCVAILVALTIVPCSRANAFDDWFVPALFEDFHGPGRLNVAMTPTLGRSAAQLKATLVVAGKQLGVGPLTLGRIGFLGRWVRGSERVLELKYDERDDLQADQSRSTFLQSDAELEIRYWPGAHPCASWIPVIPPRRRALALEVAAGARL